METQALTREIISHPGLGPWTAAIIQLFYLGREDVFPQGDRGLMRAISALERIGTLRQPNYRFDPDRASPHRSYLALYLWQAGVRGFLNNDPPLRKTTKG